jgi:hypothetical protein
MSFHLYIIYKNNFVAKQGLLFLLGENQKKGKRDREALSVGIAGAKASAIRPIGVKGRLE